MIYICECGCELQRSELKVVGMASMRSGKRLWSNRLACPEHKEKGLVAKRRVFCAEDGCTGHRDLKPHGSGAALELCDKCFDAVLAKQNRAHYKKYSAKKPLSDMAALMVVGRNMFDDYRDIDAWDCESRDYCLDVYDKFSSMPCKNCLYYRPVDFKHKNMQTAPDYAAASRFRIYL